MKSFPFLMLAFYALCFVFCFNIHGAHSAVHDSFRTISKNTIPLDRTFKEIKLKNERIHLSEFGHLKHLLSALSRNEDMMTILEATSDFSSSSMSHYTIKPNILAVQQHETIVEDSHLVHCKLLPHSNYELVVGEVAHLPHARRILRIEPHPSKPTCSIIHTISEPIHPLELFSTFKVEAMVDRRLQMANRRLQNEGRQVPTSTVTMPDPDQTPGVEKWGPNQLIPCNPLVANKWPGEIAKGKTEAPVNGYLIPYKANSIDKYKWEYFFGASVGCFSATMDPLSGGMNFNWTPDPSGDPTKGGQCEKPKITIDGITGAECADCYAFIGAQLYLIFEYGRPGGVMAEVRAAGAAGFNVAVNIENPTIVGTGTVSMLLKEAKDYSAKIPIGASGLSISFKNGGLSATPTGTGKLVGTANFGAGL